MQKFFFKPNQIAFILFLFVILLYPIFIHSNYYIGVMNIVGIYTILTIGLNILMGYAGQISLGHAAFFGIGAYVSGVLTAYNLADKFHFPIFLSNTLGNHIVAAIAAVIITSILALIIAIPTLKLHGHYLAMATLGVGIIVYIFLKEESWMTGGSDGLIGIPSLKLFGFSFDSTWKLIGIDFGREKNFYYLIWFVTIAIIILSQNLINSRVGRALRSIHSSEVAAQTLGVNVTLYKIKVFILSSIYSSIAGSLYAHYMQFVSPGSFSFMFSIKLVTMVVIGGMASIWGAVFGAFVLTILPENLYIISDSLQTHLPYVASKIKSPQDLEIIVYGLILIVVMIFLPQGLTRGVLDMIEIFKNKYKLKSKKIELDEDAKK